MYNDIIIIGAGGHGKVIADIIKRAGDNVYGYLDDNSEDSKVIGKIDDCTKFKDKFFVIAIGDNKTRKKIAEKYPGLKYYSAIHPMAVVSDDVKIGDGTVIMANAVINPGTEVGNHCIINTASVIEHDNYIENYVHVSPGATICGTVIVGENSHIGAGSVIKNNISICENVTVGVGASVVANIIVPGTYIGVPAKLARTQG